MKGHPLLARVSIIHSKSHHQAQPDQITLIPSAVSSCNMPAHFNNQRITARWHWVRKSRFTQPVNNRLQRRMDGWTCEGTWAEYWWMKRASSKQDHWEDQRLLSRFGSLWVFFFFIFIFESFIRRRPVECHNGGPWLICVKSELLDYS